MLNYIWGFMILSGIIYGAFSGNIAAVGTGAVDSAKEAVSLCITMLGVMSLWTGIMEVAASAGIMDKMTRIISPFVRLMFPNIPTGHKVNGYITTNIIANILGLGWAATPAGLKAMEELSNLEDERRRSGRCSSPQGVASNEMCTFLILNISSLQLIPVNIIAYRSQYGSVNPTAIVGPAIVATAVSTAAAIVFCKVMDRKRSII